MTKILRKIFLFIRKWFRYLYQIWKQGYAVLEIVSITAGKRHAWLRTSIGLIRKPLGTFETIN